MSPKCSAWQYDSMTILSEKPRFLPSSPPTPGKWAFHAELHAGEGLWLPRCVSRRLAPTWRDASLPENNWGGKKKNKNQSSWDKKTLQTLPLVEAGSPSVWERSHPKSHPKDEGLCGNDGSVGVGDTVPRQHRTASPQSQALATQWGLLV